MSLGTVQLHMLLATSVLSCIVVSALLASARDGQARAQRWLQLFLDDREGPQRAFAFLFAWLALRAMQLIRDISLLGRRQMRCSIGKSMDAEIYAGDSEIGGKAFRLQRPGQARGLRAKPSRCGACGPRLCKPPRPQAAADSKLRE